MNPLRPLLFLTVRTLFNGVRRALSTPRRLITLIALVAYYFFIFIRPALGPIAATPPGMSPRLQFPPLEVIDALAFGLFSGLSLFMMLGVLSQQGSFKPADVDMLFPTPISPKVVLVFRMIRDYLLTLVVPLLIVILGFRPAKMGWESLFERMPNPQYSGLALRAMTLSWVLMAMGWVAISYAISLFISRSDRQSDRNRRVLTTCILTLVVGVVGFLFLEFSRMDSVQDLLNLSRSAFLRTVFFNASFASMLTVAPFHASLPMAAVGGGSLAAIVVVGVSLAMRQAGWMYDQAAVRGFGSTRAKNFQQTGDLMGAAAERARSGKMRTKSGTWAHRLRLQGPLALLWKEMFLQPRSMRGLLVFMTIMGLALCAMPSVMASSEKKNIEAGYLLLMMEGSTLMMLTMGLAQTGFIELLKRVDLQKPMPFTPATIVFFEVASKALIGAVIGTLGALLAVILDPSLWQFALTAVLSLPFASLLLSASMCLLTILFPDIDDASQRQFRGLLSLLLIAILGLFPAAAFGAVTFLGGPVVLAGVAASLVCLLLSLGLTYLAGTLYATYNPSE